MLRGSNSPGRRERDERVEAVEKVKMEVDIPRDLAGLVIGKAGSTTKRISQRSGANVRVEIPKVAGDRTFVVACGTLDQVQKVLSEVRDEVAKKHPEIARQLQGKFTMGLAATDQTRETKDLGKSLASAEGVNENEWDYRDITACVTVSAKKDAFKCLTGKNGENLKKIRDKFAAKIVVEDFKKAGETQHAYISGRIEDVIAATPEVKESLERYRPEHDPRKNFETRDAADRGDAMVIGAEGSVKIKAEAAGFFIGKKGENIKKITYETGVDHLEVNAELRGGFKDVNIVGGVTPVLRAIQKVQESMRRYPGKAAKSDDTSRESGNLKRPARETTAPNSMGASAEPAMPLASTTAAAPSAPPPTSALPPQQSVQQAPIPSWCLLDGVTKQIDWMPNGDGTYTPVPGIVNQTTSGSQQNGGPPGLSAPVVTQQLPENPPPQHVTQPTAVSQQPQTDYTPASFGQQSEKRTDWPW